MIAFQANDPTCMHEEARGCFQELPCLRINDGFGLSFPKPVLPLQICMLSTLLIILIWMFKKLRESTHKVLWLLSFFNGWEWLGSPGAPNRFKFWNLLGFVFLGTDKKRIFKLLRLGVRDCRVGWPQILVPMESMSGFWLRFHLGFCVLQWSRSGSLLPPWLLQRGPVLGEAKVPVHALLLSPVLLRPKD